MFEAALIDGLKFARERQRLEGDLPVARLPRLAEDLFDSAGNVSYALAGFVDERGRPGIDVRTRARLGLVCRRCLSRVDFDLDRRTRFLLAADEAELPELAEEGMEIETVTLQSVSNVFDLIEQEVLLGLPMAPSHPEGACTPPEQPAQAESDSPFAALRRLKDSEQIDSNP